MDTHAMHMRKAAPEEAHFVYERDLVKAFPPMELRTWSEIENLARRGKYEFLCLYDGADIVGTITLCPVRPGWIFWDYFCVTASRRNAGLGERMAKDLWKLYPDSVILMEVEAPEHAPNPALAARRLGFYKRNGARQSGFEAELFGVRYHVIYWADVPIPDADIQREYDDFCRDIFPPGEYERYVRIPYRALEEASTPISQERTN